MCNSYCIQKGDEVYGKALLVFGADHKLFNSKCQLPVDLAVGEFSNVLSCLASKPEMDDDAVPYIPEVNTDLLDVWNARLDDLVSDRNICNFAYWMEKQLDKANEGSMGMPSIGGIDFMGMPSIGDTDRFQSQVMQSVELRRWQDTAKPVRPGGRVLFLDGGGIRCLIQVEILMEIERRTGRKITELFDWFVGTNIGSVVAAGLVYGEIHLLVILILNMSFT